MVAKRTAILATSCAEFCAIALVCVLVLQGMDSCDGGISVLDRFNFARYHFYVRWSFTCCLHCRFASFGAHGMGASFRLRFLRSLLWRCCFMNKSSIATSQRFARFMPKSNFKTSNNI